MRFTTTILLTLAITGAIAFAPGGSTAPAQITLVNTATGGPPTATTVGTNHSLDSKNFTVGAASILRTPASGTSHLPTKAALDPATAGSGGASAAPGFTIQWWYKPAGATLFGYHWSDRGWGSFRCFQNGAAGVGEVIIRGPLVDCKTTGSVLVNSLNAAGWIHLAVTVNTKANLTTWYVNGKLNNSTVPNITGKGTAFVCFGDTGSSSGYQGNADDFRIYNWARTAADVAADFNKTATGKGPSGSPNVPDLGYYECELPVSLVAAGSPKPGGTVTLDMTAIASANLTYQLGTALGTGPILIDTRKLGLSPDPLLFLSVSGLAPTVFQAYAGTLDASGKGQGKINIPNIAALVGVRLYNAFVTIKVGEPSNIKSISPTVLVTITT